MRHRAKKTATDPLRAERRRLGALQHETLIASSLVAAHGALGALLREPARRALAQRLSGTPTPRLEGELRRGRDTLAFLRARAGHAGPVPAALAEYLACLDAWSEAAGLGDLVPVLPAVDGDRPSRLELATFAQDDNGGCQTALLRRRDGSVLLFHTEEDTIGHFDVPRVVSLLCPGLALSAFLYPYLLPGPAFGWSAEQVHALDSLHLRRRDDRPGALTSVAAWLTWRLGPAASLRELCAALAPFADACALNLVYAAGPRVAGVTHEIGARHRHSRRLGPRPGDLCYQGNTVSDPGSALGRDQHLDAAERGRYERRRQRAEAALRGRGDLTPQELLDLLCDRRGGTYGNANLDVKGHMVGWLRSEQGRLVGELHVAAGAVLPGDRYQPRWRWS